MTGKVRVRVLSAFMLADGAVAKVGSVIDIDPLQAYDLSPSQGEILDPERAKVLIAEAAKAATEAAARKCGPIPRGLQLPGGQTTTRWNTILPDASGYRPRVH